MLRNFLNRALLALSILSVPLSASASEADLQEAYAAYQVAAEAGDLHGALPHAERAHRLAELIYGPDVNETVPYLTAYVRSLNDVFQHEEAWSEIQTILEGSSIEPHLLYGLFFEGGRARRGLRDFEGARNLFDTALDAAVDADGPDSLEAAFAHLELARVTPNYSDVIFEDDIRDRVIGSGYGYHKGSQHSLDRATEIFAAHPGRQIELEILNVTRAGYYLADDDQDGAEPIIVPAIDALEGLSYMDDYVLTLYVDWIARHLTQWRTRRMERYLTRAFELGALRREGRPIPLARTHGIINRRACVDTEPGFIEMEFSVNTLGQLPRIRTHETSHPGRWDREVWRIMRGWAFIPGQVDAVTTRVDGLRHRLVFSEPSPDC